MRKLTQGSVIACVTIFFIRVCKSDDSASILKENWEIVSTSYPKYQATETFLKLMKKSFPANFDYYSIGKTVQGKSMYVARLGNSVNEDRAPLVPKMKIVANMHGDETLGRALSLMLAVDLIKRSKENDRRAERILKETEIHLLITMNPDGFEAVKEGNCYPKPEDLGRSNANGKDLNRDFPDQFRDKETDFNKLLQNRQPETQNVMKWIKNNDFVLSANLHALKVVASYPFDSVPLEVENKRDYDGTGIISYSPDHAFFFNVATTYANNHKTMREGCQSGEFKNGVVNGAEWYNVRGGMQDFNYVHSNCFEVTFELSCCKVVPSKKLPGEWENNKESLYKFIETTHSGAKGIVTKDGKPVKNALIHVKGINHEVTTNERGEYWRLLMPGKYTMWASADGNHESDKVDITVNDSDPPTATIQNFQLS